MTVTLYTPPSTAAAGTDQTLCNATTFTMAATDPPAGTGTGTWTKLSGPSGGFFLSKCQYLQCYIHRSRSGCLCLPMDCCQLHLQQCRSGEDYQLCCAVTGSGWFKSNCKLCNRHYYGRYRPCNWIRHMDIYFHKPVMDQHQQLPIRYFIIPQSPELDRNQTALLKIYTFRWTVSKRNLYKQYK